MNKCFRLHSSFQTIRRYAKDVRFGIDARARMLDGVNELADAVQATMGPKGRHVLIEQKFGAPKVTKDGVTVAKAMAFQDRLRNAGASLVKQVANKTNEAAGDGTTCATILTRAIFAEGCKSVASGINVMDLRQGINMAVEATIEHLKSMATMISTPEEISQVATISSNGEKEVGELIAKAMAKVGKDGVITVTDGKTFYNELDVVEGIKLARGYISPHFMTNQKTQICEFENPLILVHEKKISSLQAVLPLLEQLRTLRRPVLIVADDVDGDALAALAVNKVRANIKLCAIKAPGFGSYRLDHLHDFIILTGAKLVSEDTGLNLQKLDSSVFGTAKKVTVTKDETIILGAGGDKRAIEERCEQIRGQLKLATSAFDKEKLQERYARLSGGIAVIKVGGATDIEVSEKKDRVIDALNATRAAVEEGIVPGGGVAFLRASRELDKLQPSNFDQRVGIQIIQTALKVPTRAIAENAGYDGATVEAKVLNYSDPNMGFDAAKGEYLDLVKAGIIDPVKVLRSALVDAASVSSLLTTSEAIVYDDEYVDKERKVPKGLAPERIDWRQ